MPPCLTICLFSHHCFLQKLCLIEKATKPSKTSDWTLNFWCQLWVPTKRSGVSVGYLATFNLVRSEKQHRLIRDHRRRKSMQSSIPQIFLAKSFCFLFHSCRRGSAKKVCVVASILNVTGDFYIKPSRFKKKDISWLNKSAPLRGNPPNLQYICIVWSPQNG